MSSAYDMMPTWWQINILTVSENNYSILGLMVLGSLHTYAEKETMAMVPYFPLFPTDKKISEVGQNILEYTKQTAFISNWRKQKVIWTAW